MTPSTRPMTAAERTRRLAALGYGLGRHRRCVINGRVYPYVTYPTESGGSLNYFRTLHEVDAYVRQVEQVRHWQDCPVGADALRELTGG